MTELATQTASTTPPTPVLTWVHDPIHKTDATYRVSIDGSEYIRSTRKPRKHKPPRPPRVKKPRVYKPVTLTPEERLKRKAYMLGYRRKKKAEVRRLQAEVERLNRQPSTTSTPATVDDAKNDETHTHTPSFRVAT